MKRILSVVLSLVLLCSLTVFTASAESETVTVVFWNSWTGGDGDTLVSLVDKFNSEQDEVYIDMTRSTSFSDMLLTALPTGEAADLVLLNPNSYSTYDGYLRPMDDIWENTSLSEDDFLTSYMSMCYIDDELYGIPFQLTTYVLYYNIDLFEEAGITEVPTTFDEWTEAAIAISALSTEDDPIYGSGLFYCYNGQNMSVVQRFGTGYMIEGDEESGFYANLLDNEALADAMIWMKYLYDGGYNPLEQDIDSMMAAGQIGIMANGGWLKATLDASDVNYGIAKLPTVTGEDQESYSLGLVSTFTLTTSATDETALAAEKFIEWWFTGTGLSADESTNGVDYSNVTPNAEWSLTSCYINAYIPTIESEEYQADEVLVSLTPDEDAQVQMYCEVGTLFYSDTATLFQDMIEDWVFNGPTDPTYDDVQEFLEVYQEDLESYIEDYYG